MCLSVINIRNIDIKLFKKTDLPRNRSTVKDSILCYNIFFYQGLSVIDFFNENLLSDFLNYFNIYIFSYHITKECEFVLI